MSATTSKWVSEHDMQQLLCDGTFTIIEIQQVFVRWYLYFTNDDNPKTMTVLKQRSFKQICQTFCDFPHSVQLWIKGLDKKKDTQQHAAAIYICKKLGVKLTHYHDEAKGDDEIVSDSDCSEEFGSDAKKCHKEEQEEQQEEEQEEEQEEQEEEQDKKRKRKETVEEEEEDEFQSHIASVVSARRDFVIANAEFLSSKKFISGLMDNRDFVTVQAHASVTNRHKVAQIACRIRLLEQCNILKQTLDDICKAEAALD